MAAGELLPAQQVPALHELVLAAARYACECPSLVANLSLAERMHALTKRSKQLRRGQKRYKAGIQFPEGRWLMAVEVPPAAVIILFAPTKLHVNRRRGCHSFRMER